MKIKPNQIDLNLLVRYFYSMTYLCFYDLTVEPGKEQNLVESLKRSKVDIGIYSPYLKSFRASIVSPGIVQVKAELTSEEAVPKLGGYLKAQKHVENISIHTTFFYPPGVFYF